MKICAIFNIAPAYRKAIYTLMDSELDCDMFFGDHSADGIAMLRTDRSQELGNCYKGTKLVWQRGAIRRAFSRRYGAYVLTGNAGIRSNWIIILIARMLGRKVYLWSHGLHGNESPAVLRKNLAYLRFAGNALLYGHRAQELLAFHGFTATTVIYNSLDYDHQMEIRSRTGDAGFIRNYFGNEFPTICYLGRLVASKRIDMLLRAIEDIDCNLIIVGGGKIADELQRYAAEIGVEEKVWFYGESYDEVFNGTLLENCAVTVNPSSIGLTAIHSLMFGTPVITHDHHQSQAPEAEVIVEGVTGYYYRHNDERSLRDTIRRAISQPKPREECYKIIESKYNPHVQIEILKNIFGTKIDDKVLDKK